MLMYECFVQELVRSSGTGKSSCCSSVTSHFKSSSPAGSLSLRARESRQRQTRRKPATQSYEATATTESLCQSGRRTSPRREPCVATLEVARPFWSRCRSVARRLRREGTQRPGHRHARHRSSSQVALTRQADTVERRRIGPAQRHRSLGAGQRSADGVVDQLRPQRRHRHAERRAVRAEVRAHDGHGHGARLQRRDVGDRAAQRARGRHSTATRSRSASRSR